MNARSEKKRTVSVPPRGPGRPIEGQEAKRRYQVLLEPRIAENLRRVGDGNLSRGIARVAADKKGSGAEVGIMVRSTAK